MESKEGDELAWHAVDVEDILEFFGSDENEGLTSERVQELREQYGANQLEAKENTPLWQLILEQFEDPLVITLLVAAGISAGTGLWDHYNPEDGEAQHGSVLEAMVEPIVILVILFFNAFVGVWQESNAENALEALKSLQSEHATVIRDGHVQQIEAVDVVPGDLFIVQVGDRVPADGRVVRLETTTLRIEQASLTGESETVLKDHHSVAANADITAKTNMLFSSTGVAGGRAMAVATSIGMSTELGKVQSAVQEADEDEDTPLKKKIGVFGYQLQVVIFVICVLVWVINYYNFFDEEGKFSVKRCLYYLKIAVALAVAAIPEGLPAVITTCLALGTRKMAKKNAIVRKLPSVETLGCTTVICSDKTGTLTTNEMSVVRLVYFDDRARIESHIVHGTSYDPTLGGVDGIEGFEESDGGISNISQVASLCNDARITFEEGKFKRLGQPTEAALKVLSEKMGVPGSGRADPHDQEVAASSVSDHWTSQFKRVATLEFSRDRKSMGVILSRAGSGVRTRRSSSSTRGNILMVKGAPESVIDRCTKVRCADGSTVPLDARLRAELLKTNDAMAGDALRCIALAIRDDGLPFDLDTYDGSEDSPGHAVLRDDSSFVRIESDLTFVGLTGIIDPPRPEVRGSIELCVQAGIRVIVITGDNKKTAESVCRNIGIFDDDESLQGKSFIGREFMELSESEQTRALFSDEGGRVFSRAEPAHKQVIIKLLKSNDQVTAMTGDGVNDAPALKAADIGIAMGISGTEVAKEASDMILADDNFATIVSAVEEGRSIYNNTKAFIRYLISSNIGEVASIFITAALGLPEIMVPVQLLWVNLVTDGPPATALGFNPADAMIMKIPPRRSDDQLISAWVFFRYMVIGLYVGFATVGIFVYWFCYYDYAADGHDLVSVSELMNWVSCTPAAIQDESSPWFGFNVENSGGFDLGGNSCNYFSDGKITAATLSLSVLVTIEMLNALNALSEDGSLLQMPPWCNPWLLVAMTASMLLHCVILYIPAAAGIFGVAPLDLQDWILVFYFSVPVIFIDEILKLVGRIRTNAAMAKRMKDKHA